MPFITIRGRSFNKIKNILDPIVGKICYANAGHPPAYLRTSEGIQEMRARGMPLGLLEGMAYEEKDTVMSPGDSLLLNFSQVSYINSTGIALFVGLLARARKSHRTLAVYGLSDHYREIFELTRLADLMSIYPDEANLLDAQESRV